MPEKSASGPISGMETVASPEVEGMKKLRMMCTR
jgi:hypothetical protein